MARRSTTRVVAPAADLPQPDRIEGFPHPRETFHLTGQKDALAIASRAIRSGRPPQAWLISGPPGIGKATLAYRIARYLLAYGATTNGPEDLAVAPNNPAAMQMSAGAHPGLLVLKRAVNDKTGKLMTVLSVEVARKLGSFFGMTSGAGGWRVAIIDTADDMNDNAANALLKLLEEPPSNAMLLLLTNAPGKLLPTIRSRCQRLPLRPLTDAELEIELARHLPDLKDRATLVHIAGGSLGLALQLASGDGLALARDAEKLIDTAGNPDIPAIAALGERAVKITDGLETLGDFLGATLSERIRARAASESPGLDRWIAAWEATRESITRSTGLNLEPRQTVLSVSRTLGNAARKAGQI